jgi:thiol-disulfide isomerase/thioredoxin
MLQKRVIFLFIFTGIICLTVVSQNSVSKNQSQPIKDIQYWRGVFTLESGTEIPFNFIIRSTPHEALELYFKNADEEFKGGILTLKGDSVYIPLDAFDNELVFRYDLSVLTGVLRKQDKTGTPLPVRAEINRQDRFSVASTKKTVDVSGTYNIQFSQPGNKEEKAVGIFAQKGTNLTATFLRVTGDSRYLEGSIDGDQFYLSSFIGSSPVLYKGSILNGNQLTGEVIGPKRTQSFKGTLDKNTALPDPYTLTRLKDGFSTLDFAFPDVNGKVVSLKDDKFQNKVVIITIGGTWCPNCIDEAAFLSPWYKENKARGVEIISLQYERKLEPDYVKKALARFRDRFSIEYDQLFAGIADKQKVQESLPQLNTFISFPTTIFIGRNGKVSKIHTGFTGPATGQYYEHFVKDFNDEVTKLLRL